VKVVGLGAPVSVRIRFQACEADVIASELGEQILVEERTEAEARAGLIGEEPDDEIRNRLGEFRRMLDDIQRAGGAPGEPFEVVWATVLAHEVLRGALGQATERLDDALNDLDNTAAIRDAVNVVGALLDTWEAFLAVDAGGRQDVAL
jgi:hypothetical protein